MICGAETCPESGRPHTQGSVILQQPQTLSSVQTLLQDPSLHLEQMKGTPTQCETYCSKEDPDPFTIGSKPQQGKRTDLILLKEALDDPLLSLPDVWNDHFPAMLKYDQAAKRYKLATTQPRDGSVAPSIIIHIGSSGCGKTRAMPTGANVYWHPCTDKWWDGYSGQDTVVFDEFYGQLKYQFMLRVLDRYALTVETKGGTVQLTATKFYFTSNQDWEHWWAKAQKENTICMLAFIRRIEEFGTVIKYN